MLHVNALPSTGDNTPLVMLFALMLLSLTGMGLCLDLRRKNRI